MSFKKLSLMIDTLYGCLDSFVGRCNFFQFGSDVDEMGNETLSRLIDRISTSNLLVLLHLFLYETDQDIAFEDGSVEGRFLAICESNVHYFDYLVMQHAAHGVFPK
jgi:hypothetical protein